MVAPKDYKPSDWVEPDADTEDTDREVGTDTALEMLGGLMLMLLVIAFCVGVYFVVTRW